MIKSLLIKLATALTNTASNHKKKLIFIAILIIGYKIARKKLNAQHIISTAMFFMKLGSKAMQIFPLPVFANYRLIEPFKFQPQPQIPEFANVIEFKQLLVKIKNKEPGALNELKVTVLSGVILNLVLYKVTSIYELILRKYKMDFEELGAGAPFQQSIALLKIQFLKNLPDFRLFIVSHLHSELSAIEHTQMVDEARIKNILLSLIQKLQKETTNINGLVLSRKTNAQSTKQYKVAQNYFKSTKQYIPQKQPTKAGKIMKFLFLPATTMIKGISSLLKMPDENITSYRYEIIQYLYILPLKKFKGNAVWPTLQSKYLFGMVLDELINFFYSLNFSVVSYRKARSNLETFMNRIHLYFTKKQKCEKKKMMDLLPIFYKIIKQEMVTIQRKKDFYDRELINAFKDTMYEKTTRLPIQQHRLRNRILTEIYYQNQVQHLEKDMQAKLYNERDGLTIEPTAKNSRIYEEKDEIEQFMELHNNADVQKETTSQQMQLMREFIK